MKYDDGKCRTDLLPVDALEEVAWILTFGADKYEDHGWEHGMDWMRLIGACFRHIFAWIGGQDNDPETGRSHIAHACCCLLFILAYIKRGMVEYDDRWCNLPENPSNQS